MKTRRPGDTQRRAGIGRSALRVTRQAYRLLVPARPGPRDCWIGVLLGTLLVLSGLVLSGCQQGPGTPPARADDHGDSAATATRLGDGDGARTSRLAAATADDTLSVEFRTEGTLTEGDFDYFVLTVGQAGTLTARTSGSTDTYGYLEARTDHHRRTVLDEDDNSGGGRNFRVTAWVTPGIYYIGVMGSSTTTTGYYELWVTFSATATLPATGTRMYWTDSATDRVQRANLDGSVIEDVVAGLGDPRGIAIHNDKMYWTDSATDKIQRANLDGSVVEDLVAGLGDPEGIAIDDDKMYWTDSATDKIQRANLDGSAIEDLVTGVASPDGIAVHDGKVYWADSASDRIQRANLDGSAIEDLVTGVASPDGIAVHDGKLYWADSDSDRIQRANLDGSAIEDVVTGLASPEGIAIHHGKLYWTDFGTERIQRSDLDGSYVEDLVADVENPRGIAIAASGDPAPPGPEDDQEIVNTYRGHGDEVFHVNPNGESLEDLLYTLQLGNAFANVYLIVTNTNAYTAPSTIERLDTPATTTEQRPSFPEMAGRLQSAAARTEVPWRKRWITESNNYRSLADGGSFSRKPLPTVKQSDTHVFLDIQNGEIVHIPATARAVVNDGAVTLVVWVADTDWTTSCSQPPPPTCVDRAMANAVAERFLRPGSSNDIYDWVTTIFGDPWGPHSHDRLIPAEHAAQIHILVFDIDFDGEEGGTGGFFWSKDTDIRDPLSPFVWVRASNERLIFYIDSYFLGHADGPTWDVTDYSPAQMMGTLAHEFQHLIHYYQKRVRHAHGPASEAWLNEMASEVTEDLVANKLMIHGPRGVAYNDPTAGNPGNGHGRLPLYNLYNHIQVTRWTGGLVNYSTSYALGAYLARNFGGAPLFREIVQNNKSGIGALEAALRAQGHALSFGDVLTNWGVANLLSDNTGAPAPYRYNSGTWSISRTGGETYRLGSINLYHYRSYFGDDYYVDGPSTPWLELFNDGLWPQPHANLYTTLDRNTGSVRLRMSADPGIRITVVVKE